MDRLRLNSVDATTAPRIFLLIGVFLSPSIFDLGSVKPFDVSKVAVLWFFGFLAFAITIVEIIRGEIRPVRFRLATFAGLFLGATAISTVFSRTRLISIFGWYGRYNGFLQILLYVVVFWLIAQLYWRRPERLKEVFFAIAAASAVLVGYIFVQWAGLDPIKWVQPSGQKVFRYFGTMGNSNFAGGYLGATIAWLVFAFWRARSLLMRLVVVGWAFVTLFALWETSSRDGLFGAFAAGCVAVFVFRKRLPWFLQVATAAVALLVLIAGLSATFNTNQAELRPVTQETPSPSPLVTAPPNFAGNPSLLRNRTIVVRAYWWRAALSIFASRPIVGTGPDTFVIEYPRHTPASAAKVRGSERTDVPHNIFFEHAASLGILGIGSYLALLVVAFRVGLRRMREIEGIESELLGSFLVLAAGYFGQGFFSIDVAALAAIGWIAFGGIAALADPAFVRAREHAVFGDELVTPPPRPGLVRRLTSIVAMVLLAVIVVSGLRPWLADRAAKTAQREGAATASTDIVMQSFRRAMSLAPFDPVYRGLAANFLVQQAGQIKDKDIDADLLRQAVDLEKQMDSIQPGNPFWKATIGGTIANLAEVSDDPTMFEEADVWFSDAERIARSDFRLMFLHAEMLNHWGQATHDGLKYCQAIGEFKRSINLRLQAEAYLGLGQAYGALGHIPEALDALREGQKLAPENKKLSALIDRLNKLQNKKLKYVGCS